MAQSTHTSMEAEALRKENNTLAGASDTTGERLEQRDADEAVEIHPVTMFDKNLVDPNEIDFAPKSELFDSEGEDEADNPKASSAPGSALSEIFERVKSRPMPQAEPTAETESSETPEESADADKDSTPPQPPTPPSVSGLPPLSTPTKNGKPTQNAESQE